MLSLVPSFVNLDMLGDHVHSVDTNRMYGSYDSSEWQVQRPEKGTEVPSVLS